MTDKCQCGSIFIFSDTEDWKVPLCLECWIAIEQPDEDPNG